MLASTLSKIHGKKKNHFIFTECNLHKISVFWLTVRCNVPRKYPSSVFPKVYLGCDFLLQHCCHFVTGLFLSLAYSGHVWLYSEQPSSEGEAGGVQRLSLSVSQACRRVSHWFAFFIFCVEHYFIFLVSSLSVHC